MKRCQQCQSAECPPTVCRFSGMAHDEYERIKRAVNNYATAMMKRDQEEPRWLRDMRQGAPDIPNGY